MNATTSQPQPLTERLDRLTPEGRIAWHVEQALADHQNYLLRKALEAVRRVEEATKLAA